VRLEGFYFHFHLASATFTRAEKGAWPRGWSTGGTCPNFLGYLVVFLLCSWPINNLWQALNEFAFFPVMSFVNGMLSIFEMIESSDLCACQKGVVREFWGLGIYNIWNL